MSKAKSAVIPDDHNANTHTERGRRLVGGSVRKHGFRFAGAVDRNRKIIDGNLRHEEAEAAGLDEVVIIEADPTKQYYLKFDDLDLDDPTNPARELAYQANQAGRVSVEFSPDQVLDDLEAGVDLSEIFGADELGGFREQAALGAELDEMLSGGGKATPRQLGDRHKQIKAVLYVDELAVFEAALRQTGLKNRGEALIEICRVYLGQMPADPVDELESILGAA